MPVNFYDVTIDTNGILDLSNGEGIYRVETFGGAVSDTIEEITGAVANAICELRIKTSGHYWTINHDVAKKIRLVGQLGFVTSTDADRIVLRISETGGIGEELVRNFYI